MSQALLCDIFKKKITAQSETENPVFFLSPLLPICFLFTDTAHPICEPLSLKIKEWQLDGIQSWEMTDRKGEKTFYRKHRLQGDRGGVTNVIDCAQTW